MTKITCQCINSYIFLDKNKRVLVVGLRTPEMEFFVESFPKSSIIQVFDSVLLDKCPQLLWVTHWRNYSSRDTKSLHSYTCFVQTNYTSWGIYYWQPEQFMPISCKHYLKSKSVFAIFMQFQPENIQLQLKVFLCWKWKLFHSRRIFLGMILQHLILIG